MITLSALTVGDISLIEKSIFHDKVKYGLFKCEFGDVFISAVGDKISSIEFDIHPPIGDLDQAYILELLSKQTINLLLIGTLFQFKVWQTLLTIERGKTASYSELASIMGIPTSTRAVATAVGRNHICYIIPCHRILPKTGMVGNYRWGSELKKRILLIEKKQRFQKANQVENTIDK